MNKEQQELLDEVYMNYCKSYPDVEKTFQYEGSTIDVRKMTKEEFVNECKTDTEFSERWGLKIEERNLSLEERTIIFQNSEHSKHINLIKFKDIGELNKVIPTKLITITYNDTKLESYE
jgi:hypothetical protein